MRVRTSFHSKRPSVMMFSNIDIGRLLGTGRNGVFAARRAVQHRSIRNAIFNTRPNGSPTDTGNESTGVLRHRRTGLDPPPRPPVRSRALGAHRIRRESHAKRFTSRGGVLVVFSVPSSTIYVYTRFEFTQHELSYDNTAYNLTRVVLRVSISPSNKLGHVDII